MRVIGAEVVGDLQNLAAIGCGQSAVCTAIVVVACAVTQWLTVKHESSRRRSE